MGRILKRVPMDFSWPLNKTWEGYLNPHYRKCPDCNNGSTVSRDALTHLVHLILVAGKDSLKGRLHPWLKDAGIKSAGTTLHELSSGLAGRPCGILGHDACDRFSATKKVIAAAGLPEDWGTCKTCDGEAIDPAVKAAYEAWTESEPPKGDGYQLWQTTSEGSPISPVFVSLESLCEWAATNATTFGPYRATATEWRRMLDAGYVSHKERNMIFM